MATKTSFWSEEGGGDSRKSKHSDFEIALEKLRLLKEKGAGMNLSRFSWEQSQRMLKDIKGNFSDLLEEERKSC